ncbi:MAG: DsbA family protein [Alphaproteobacteria bacterium]
MLRSIRLFVLAAALALGATAAGAQGFSPEQRREIESVIREYLKEHPEFLIEVLQSAEEKQQQAQLQRAKVAIQAERKALTENPGDPVWGNPKGDVTIVEFFDYRCPYCKQVVPVLKQVIAADKGVRVVLKEFPILGRDSVFASRAALAAQKQGKYLPFHEALMAQRGQLTEEAVLSVAKATGLDVDRLKKDMADPSIEAALAANHQLAERIGIRGTPAFIVGPEMAPGAVDARTLGAMVEKARKG